MFIRSRGLHKRKIHGAKEIMKLTRFKVDHFRSLYQTDWITFSELSILTGQNDGGKSATLDALAIFLDPQRKPLENDYSLSAGSSDEKEGEITFTSMMEITEEEKSVLTADWLLEGHEFSIFKTYSLVSDDSPYQLIAQAPSDPFFHKPLRSYTAEELRQKASEIGIEFTPRDLKSDLITAFNDWSNAQTKESVPVTLSREFLNYFPMFQVFSSETSLDPEIEIRKSLLAQYRRLLESADYSGDLGNLQAKIEHDLNEDIKRLTPFVKNYSEDIDDLNIKPILNFASGLATTEMRLVRRGRPVSLSQSGAGQRRRISLAVYEWNLDMLKERNSGSIQLILAFDEPDTHLDYRSQRQIFDLIRKYAQLPAVQVIVSTHSLNFIDRVPIESISHYKLDKATRRTEIEVLVSDEHETIDLFLYEISRNMGLRNSVLLHEKCFLIIEGETEFSAIPILFNKAYKMQLQAAGVCLLNGYGNFGARMLIRFLNHNNRQALFLIDRDTSTKSDIKKYFTPESFAQDGIDEASQVFYIGAQEFEDAFSDDLWARMAEAEFKRADGRTWAEADFKAIRKSPKFSTALQEIIRNGARLSDLPPKQELGYKIAIHTKEDEIPPEILNCLRQAYDIATA